MFRHPLHHALQPATPLRIHEKTPDPAPISRCRPHSTPCHDIEGIVNESASVGHQRPSQPRQLVTNAGNGNDFRSQLASALLLLPVQLKVIQDPSTQVPLMHSPPIFNGVLHVLVVVNSDVIILVVLVFQTSSTFGDRS